jgi:hypothetical protein
MLPAINIAPVSSACYLSAMIEHLDPVPFTLEIEAHMGLSELQGILCSDGSNLVIEYRTVDTMIGLIRTEVKELSIPLADLLMITYERKWFGMIHRISIRSRRQQVLGDLPESKQGMVTFTIKRRDQKLAEAFCLEAQQLIMRNRNLRLEDELDRKELGM